MEKLRTVLSQRGITTATPALTTFLASRCIVPLPAHVVASITNTIAAASAGSTAVSAGVAGTIAKGALVAMSIKTKSLAAEAILLLLLIGSASLYFVENRKHDAALPVLATTPANLIRVRAHIDGRSRLCIRGNTVQWLHLEYDPPGLHGNVQNPTFINGTAWIPVWLDVPFGNRQCVSDVHACTAALLPANAVQMSVTAFTGRGKVSIVQQPTAANRFTAIIEFDDSVAAGAADYLADITYSKPGTAHPSGLTRELRVRVNGAFGFAKCMPVPPASGGLAKLAILRVKLLLPRGAVDGAHISIIVTEVVLFRRVRRIYARRQSNEPDS